MLSIGGEGEGVCKSAVITTLIKHYMNYYSAMVGYGMLQANREITRCLAIAQRQRCKMH